MPQQAKVSTIPGSVPHHNNHNKQGVSERVIQDHPQVITYLLCYGAPHQWFNSFEWRALCSRGV